ncbi:MAG: geranylgeranylglyceryl/heptaprenylglyceryl phosphate synthase [Fibrobacteria bacterium]|nr:geranylgeranylglyceryl/heptaprenylglyceryl phosphate synthase [Fibrobacteria bacterium]
MGPIEQQLEQQITEKGALFFILLDPDSELPENIITSGILAAQNGADAILIGGSFIGNPLFSKIVQEIKSKVDIPVILFPGGASQVSPGPDAILFTTLVSGRNPQFLIEEQVRGAMLVKAYQMEPLPTAYMLIESGKTTSVEYISNTKPIPADKPALAAIHALAAQMMGQRWTYLEAGSGAINPVPLDFIKKVRSGCDLKVIVGGGIKAPETAKERVEAGAHVIVIGNHFETNKDGALFKEFSQAIHQK